MTHSQPCIDRAFAFTRIVVACERGSGLQGLAHFALAMAAQRPTVRLTDIVCNPATLLPTLMLGYPDWCEAHRAMLHAASVVLARTAAELEATGISVETDLIDLLALHADPASTLSRAAVAWHADLIALSSPPRKHHWACHFDAEEVAASAHCPVLYVPDALLASGIRTPTRVLVAVDCSGAALQTLRVALSALPAGARLKVVHVIDRGCHWRNWFPHDVLRVDGERALQAAAEILAEHRIDAQTALLATEDELDDVQDVISRQAKAWQADLIVMSTRGRRGLSGTLPGRVASRALRDPPCTNPPVRTALTCRHRSGFRCVSTRAQCVVAAPGECSARCRVATPCPECGSGWLRR
jgi:nucleotide-binding universal stress UspA family protein